MADIDQLLDQLRQGSTSHHWQGTFQQYLAMVIEDPRLGRHAHARVHDMIQWHGVTSGSEGVPRYNLFAGTVFGLDRALDRLAQFFRAAAGGGEVRRRILLLMGPPASGKSTLVTLLKEGLERYSRSPEGATYAIKGCPMQEDPLHLVPQEQRSRMAQQYNLHIEGDLCPRCRHTLTSQYGGDILRMPVQLIYFSQSQGVGIGTFVATAPQQQDMARLVGSVDIAQFGDDRLEASGRAFRLDGELEAANRGVMEFIEIFKSDERFLAVMLGVTQEQLIKLGSFGSVHADQVVIGHSNEEEYNAFVANGQTRALLDRLILVRVPYALQLSEEVKIYRKLLATGRPAGVHLAPLSLPIAATLALLSRLDTTRRGGALPRISPLDKIKLYDGLVLPPHALAEVERLQEESPREGMYGISPRHVINRLADALSRERVCLRPLVVLNSLVEGAEERAGMGPDDRQALPELLKEALKAYKEMAVLEVRRAALEDFHRLASDQFHDYIRHATRFCSTSIEEQEGSADQRLMGRLEWAVNLKESDRPQFRRQVIQAYQGQVSAGDIPSYHTIPNLARAIDESILPSPSQLRSQLGIGGKGDDGARQRQLVEQRLVTSFGYCPVCAQDLVEYASLTLQGKAPVSVRRDRLNFG